MRLRFTCAVVLALSPLSLAVAPPPRTDRYGDPLPPGAIARIGSLRLRHAGLWDFVPLADGKTALTAGSDRVLRFWDLATGRPVRDVALQGRPGAGWFVTLSPDGKTLVSYESQTLVFFDVATGVEQKRIPAPNAGGSYMYFSPNGKQLAVGGRDRSVNLIDWHEGNQRKVALPTVARPGGMAVGGDSSTHGGYSPDGKWFVASAQSTEPLGVYEISATGLREVHRLTCYATASTIARDNKTLAIVSRQNDKGDRETLLRLYDLTTGKETKQIPLSKTDSYYWVAFSPDGSKLACGYSDHGCLVDVATGRVLHRFAGRTVMSLFTPDGKTLLANATNRLRAWDVASGKELHDRPGDLGSTVAVLSPNGQLLATANWSEQTVTLWETSYGRVLHSLPVAGAGRYVTALAFSGDSQSLYSSQPEGTIQSWDVGTGKVSRTVQLTDPGTPAGRFNVQQLHLAADGSTITTLEGSSGPGEANTRLALWDAATGKLKHQQWLSMGSAEPTWGADGKTMTVVLNGNLLRLDVESGKARLQIAGRKGQRVVASPDDRLLATDERGAVSLWESATGKEITSIATGPVRQLALAGGNRSLVTLDERQLRVWDLATGKETRSWPLPVAAPTVIRLTADGRRAFVALGDGTGLIWDVSVGRPVAKVPSEATFKAWWDELGDADARRAHAAAWRMADVPASAAVGQMRRYLRPAVAVGDVKAMTKHMDDLDSDDFRTREQATRALEALGRGAVGEMRRALDRRPGLEVRRRLEKLIAVAEGLPSLPEDLRTLRAIAVLEGVGTAQARQLLAELAKGEAYALQTQQAAAALQRLSRR